MIMRLVRSQEGFSLLEVLVAITIFSIGLLATANMQALAIKGNGLSRTVTIASTIAQDLLERYKQLGYDGTPATGVYSDTVAGSDGLTYARSWTIADDGWRKVITVTVQWVFHGTHSVILSTQLNR